MRFPFNPAKRLIVEPDGTEGDFLARFPRTDAIFSRRSKAHVLGKGQFGQVLLIHDKIADSYLACKILRKGLVFEGNVIYTPPKPNVLRGEVEILRRLHGKSYCLQLDAVYEGPRTIFVVTEVCQGGDMTQWAARLNSDLQVLDVMRIARQLFTAVGHCDRYGILHRDIKPENVMFIHNGRSSDLRLIDYGSGCIDAQGNDALRQYQEREKHQTFAGTAFYIAPEVFQRNYTGLADVWSAAVTIYVLVASYPAETLQKAFNLLQKSHRDLRILPGHGAKMPDTYFDFLTKALTYWPEQRPTARELLLTDPFLRLDQSDGDDGSIMQFLSWSLEGSSRRHVSSIKYQNEHQDDVSSWVEALTAEKGPCSNFFPTLKSTFCTVADVWNF